jgi:hypothetical protein
MRKIGKALLTGAVVVGFAALLDFVAINWVTGCESWDREQWTEQNSCVLPSDLLSAFVGKAEARELTVRERQRDVVERTSPSWEVRLERRDREARQEELRQERRGRKEWRQLTTTPDEREEECDE